MLIIYLKSPHTYGTRHESEKYKKREQKLINNLKITKSFLGAFINEEAASKEGTQISIHKTKFLQKKLQITRLKLSNNTQRCEHQLQAHKAANETYKNSQVIETQTQYTLGTVWQEFCSSDSDNISNNNSDNLDLKKLIFSYIIADT